MESGSPVVTIIRKDDDAMTAVIEFLSSFVLFLMIVTAFLSLAQMELGSNSTKLDRLDRSAVNGLQRLTDSPGWFVPYNNGIRDIQNSTSEWHLQEAQDLLKGDVLPGIVDVNGNLDQLRLSALSKITEGQLREGLGLQKGLNLHLMIQVESSPQEERIGTIIFSDGTPRSTATDSALSSRTFIQDSDTLRVTLEVHDGAKHSTPLLINEFLSYSINGEPEWIEIYNPDGFAVDLHGWSVSRTTPGIGSVQKLFTEGVLPGQGILLLTGDTGSQEVGNATIVIDIGSTGLLGVGSIEGLGDAEGMLKLGFADLTMSSPDTIMYVNWDITWGISSGESLQYLGGDSTLSENWNIGATSSPGDL